MPCPSPLDTLFSMHRAPTLSRSDSEDIFSLLLDLDPNCPFPDPVAMAGHKLASRSRVPVVDSNVVDMPDMDDATAQKLREIQEGSMQALVKHIDRRHTEKGQVYYTETKEGRSDHWRRFRHAG